MRKIVLIACLALGLSPGIAAAATPITAGQGTFDNPRMVVTASGQHHLVWPTPTAGQIGYCRIAAGDTDCNRRDALTVPGITGSTTLKGVDVSTYGASAVVVHASCDQCGAGGNGNVFRFSSDNDGLSFSPPGLKVNQASAELNGQGALAPGGTFYVGVGNTQVHAMSGAPTDTVNKPLVSDLGSARRTEVAWVPGTNQLVFAASGGIGANAIKTSLFEGAPTPAQVNTVNEWTLAHRIKPLPAPTPRGEEAALTAGPVRLAMLQSDKTFGEQSVNLRLWDAAAKTFGPPSPVHGSDTGIGDIDAHTDATGVLHAVWRSESGQRLRYRPTATDGLTFGDAITVASNEPMSDLVTGSQFAAWRGAGNAVRVVRLEALPEPPAPGPPAPPLPPGTPPGAPGAYGAEVPSPSPDAVGYSGPVYRGTDRTVRSSDRLARYDLSLPKGCVMPGQRFKVTLKWKRAKQKGNVFVKIRRADFYLNNKRVKRDTKPAFTHTYRLESSAVPGATVQLRSQATIAVRRGKAPTKSIRSTVTVCQGTPWPDPAIWGYPHATYPGPTKRVSARDRLATYRLSVPDSCIRRGQKFKVTLAATRRASAFSRIRRAAFGIAGAGTVTDAKAGFARTYTLPAGASGTVALSVKATPSVRRGKATAKTINATISVCR